MIVLDTHIWFWWLSGEHTRLSPDLLELLAVAPEVGVSPISCFELALAARRGRLQLPMEPAGWVEQVLAPSGIQLLPLDAATALSAAALPEHHRDPFDRMIIATALELDAQLASVDSAFTAYEALSGRLIA